MKALIYDIEIMKAIPNRDGAKEPGIEYCDGWHDHANMGITVIGAYDYAEGRARVFCKDNMAEFFAAADRADVLVGFNSIPFDNAVIRACWSAYDFPRDEKCYDLLRETWAAAGLGAAFDFKTHGGYGLDAICERNFGSKKSGNGALAPVLWQLGQIGKVIDYCLNDIRLTKQLFDAVLAGKPIISPKDGSELMLRTPWGSAPREDDSAAG